MGDIPRLKKNADGKVMTNQAGFSGSGRGMDEGQTPGYGGWGDMADGGRERGSRRKKVYGYLKAANELRQTYSTQWAQKYQDATDDKGMPGDFPEVEPVTYGNEEMILFPSYARRHVRKHPQEDVRSEMEESEGSDGPSQTTGNPEYWQREWEKYEDDHAIVDVDVKGWIYSPHQGPLSRKNRILISLARKLSGIPAPDPSPAGDSTPDPPGNSRQQLVNHDEALVNKEARAIMEKDEESNSQTRQESSLSQNDIAAANAELMERLNPFLRNPIVGLPATVFFFDDKQSQSRTVMTNAGGHFYLRAALEFVPTHIRVLAVDNLSATAEVKILEPHGVSMISDIDDTIKHSAIASGAKEMFRNTFVRNLNDLTVLGVKEWYTKVADMGVEIHYVSNSPWQLYPLLKNFFSLTGLPQGSFHLKQYSGMLQGIFEPSSERKRPTLERIMHDFPERRFILVGDSGEADLEAYTELVLENPGKILAIFIRDVTTSKASQFFDRSAAHLDRVAHGTPTPRAVMDHSDTAINRPSLPPRRPTEQMESAPESATPIGNLIDLDSEDDISVGRTQSAPNTKQGPPPLPPKPVALRAAFSGDKDRSSLASIARKPVPPVPEKPQRLASNKIISQSQERMSASTPNTALGVSDNEGHLASVRNRATDIYNNLPPARELWENRPNLSQVYDSIPSRSRKPPPVPPPRRSTNHSALASSASKSTPDFFHPSTTTSSSASSTSSIQQTFPPPSSRARPTPSPIRSSSSTPNPDQPILNRREETWNRRWLRAQEILGDHGVLLTTWRVGSDVQDLCVTVVEQALADDKHRTRGNGG